METSPGQNEFSTTTASGAATLRRRYYGPLPIIQHYLRRMNLAGIVEQCLGCGCREADMQGLTHAQVTAILVHNCIVSALPLYRISEWASCIEPAAMGITSQQGAAINDDRIARTLNAIGSGRARSLFFRPALRVVKDFSIRAERFHFDTTSVTLRGEYQTSREQPRITHGHNKDGRPDLKQLVFGLAICADGAVALHHNVWSGNRADDTVHGDTVDALRKLVGRNEFIYVADSKLASDKNLALIDQGGGKFVSVYPANRKEVKQFIQQLYNGASVTWHPIAHDKTDKQQRYWSCSSTQEHTAQGYRIVWVRSSHKRHNDQPYREQAMQKATAALQQLRLNRAYLKTRAQIAKAVSAIIAKHKVNSFLSVEIPHRFETKSPPTRRRHIKRRNEPSHKDQPCRYYLRIAPNTTALQQQKNVDGVFPLVTNLDTHQYGAAEVLSIYKYQPYVEKKFALLKSELCVCPLFLKKPRRVAAMLHVYFIALVLASLIERTLRAAMKRQGIDHMELLPEQRFTKNPTCPRVLEAFTDLCAYEVKPHNQPMINFPLQLSERQKHLLQLLEVPESNYR